MIHALTQTGLSHCPSYFPLEIVRSCFVSFSVSWNLSAYACVCAYVYVCVNVDGNDDHVSVFCWIPLASLQ